MKFTRLQNIVICATVTFIVAAMTFNQVTSTGKIDLFEIGKVLVAAIPVVLSILAHSFNPDGTKASVAYDPTRKE